MVWNIKMSTLSLGTWKIAKICIVGHMVHNTGWGWGRNAGSEGFHGNTHTSGVSWYPDSTCCCVLQELRGQLEFLLTGVLAEIATEYLFVFASYFFMEQFHRLREPPFHPSHSYFPHSSPLYHYSGTTVFQQQSQVYHSTIFYDIACINNILTIIPKANIY